MAKINNATKRIQDLSGWINRLKSDTNIDDNQCVVSNNWWMEGNKFASIKWFASVHKFGTTNSRIQWLSSYGDYVISIQDTKLYVHNIVNGLWANITISWISNLDDFNITIGKFVDIYIIVTNVDWSDTPRSFKLVESTMVITNDSSSFVGFTWTPTCSIFYQGQLLFSGIPSSPSVLYYSKPFISTDTTPSWYKFDAYPAWAQTIWDWSPIVWFLTWQDKLYIWKKNSIWKVDWVSDTGAWADAKFSYTVTKQTSTWPINQESFINVMQDIFFYDGHSIRRLSYEANTLALKDSSISDNIQPYLASFPQDQKSATSWFSYPYYKLAIRQELSSDNDFVFAYNVINKSFITQTWLITRHSTNSYFDKSIAYFGSSYDWTVYRDNFTYTYDWQAIDRSYIGKALDYGDSIDYKRLTEVEISWLISPWHLVYIDIIKDSQIIDTREIFFASSLWATTWASVIGASTSWAFWANSEPLIPYAIRFECYDDGRTFQLWVRNNSTWYFEIQYFNTMYKFLKAFELHY